MRIKDTSFPAGASSGCEKCHSPHQPNCPVCGTKNAMAAHLTSPPVQVQAYMDSVLGEMEKVSEIVRFQQYHNLEISTKSRAKLEELRSSVVRLTESSKRKESGIRSILEDQVQQLQRLAMKNQWPQPSAGINHTIRQPILHSACSTPDSVRQGRWKDPSSCLRQGPSLKQQSFYPLTSIPSNLQPLQVLLCP